MLKKLWESETELGKVKQMNSAILAEVESAVASGKSKASTALKETLRKYAGSEMRMSEIGSSRVPEPKTIMDNMKTELAPVKEQEVEVTNNTFNERERELLDELENQAPVVVEDVEETKKPSPIRKMTEEEQDQMPEPSLLERQIRMLDTESFLTKQSNTQRETNREALGRKLSVEEFGTARSKDSFLTKQTLEGFDPNESVSDILKKFREE